MWEAIIDQAYDAFRTDLATTPAMTLRGGNAVDSYNYPPPYDAAIDQPTDDYIAAYTFWGLGYLDAASWRHYLPQLIAYTFRHLADPATMAPEGLLYSLRPPDCDPPRLATLTTEQEAVIVAFLEALALGDNAEDYQADALQILEEWWLPNARYRDRPGQEG
jgi:hypothetical protein